MWITYLLQEFKYSVLLAKSILTFIILKDTKFDKIIRWRKQNKAVLPSSLLVQWCRVSVNLVFYVTSLKICLTYSNDVLYNDGIDLQFYLNPRVLCHQLPLTFVSDYNIAFEVLSFVCSPMSDWPLFSSRLFLCLWVLFMIYLLTYGTV